MSQQDAVVVGGSVAGLLAAAALARSGQSVLVLERDAPPEAPIPRRGAPQGTQVHALLDSGRQAIESLLPGVFGEIEAAGGRRLDFGIGMRWYSAGHYRTRCQTPYIAQVQSRPLLEHHIRRRVAAMDNVTLLTGRACDGLVVEGRRIAGVRAGDTCYLADRVVLATGRGARPARWLEGVGIAPPPIRRVKIGIGYATGIFQLPPQWPADQGMLLTYGTRPDTRRHGLAFRVEGGRMMVTLMGYFGDHPPTDPAEFAAFARSLERPELGALVEAAAPIGRIRRYSCPEQIRYDFHRIRLPEGLLLVGDAVCGLDPVFGQGMSVAAQQAALLAERPAGRTAPLMRAFAAAADRAWLITSLEAARYQPESFPIPGVGLVHAWLDRINARSAHDGAVYRAFLAVVNLHRSAAWLLHPALIWRVLTGRSPQGRAISQ